MYLSGHTDAPVTLETRLPPGWKVATGLTPQPKDQPLSPNRLFQAKNYDEMVDCPLQFGKFDAFSFKVNGVPFQCILVGDHRANTPKLTRTLTRVVQAGFSLFGKFPFSQYLFIFHCGGAGFFGGLEHRNSTVIHTSPDIGDGEGDELLPVTMHEFFHAWNVKRIRPAKLGPFDYTQAVRTPSVWFAEGVTDYYAALLLARAGLRSKEWLLGDLAGRIGNVDSTPSRRWVTLEEAGSKAWEGASMGFDGLNYYLKGSAIGFYFDMRVRALTQGRRNLDDVMRELDTQFGEKNIGYPEEAILQTLNRVSGADLTTEYNAYVRGVEEIPWEKTAAALGLTLKREAVGFLGVQFDDNGISGRPKAQTVLKGFAAEKMGMVAGDVLQSLNGVKVTSVSVRDAILSLKPNTPLKVAIEREGMAMELEGMADAQYRWGTLVFAPQAQITPLALRLRTGFFAVLPMNSAGAAGAVGR
jgi:predicted metalloprotease with PDZ domain